MSRRESDGWITPLVLMITKLFSSVGEIFYGARGEAQVNQNERERVTRRAIFEDTYVAAWLIFESNLYLATILFVPQNTVYAGLIILIALFRICTIVSVTLRTGLLGDFINKEGNVPSVASQRILILGLVNYFELLLCFAVIYLNLFDELTADRKLDWFDPIYFSFITLFTICYSDIQPVGKVRYFVCLQ